MPRLRILLSAPVLLAILLIPAVVISQDTDSDKRSLTIDSILHSALEHNQAYLSQMRSVGTASGLLNQARLLPNPQGTVQFDYAHVGRGTPNSPAGFAGSITQPIYLAGQRSRRIALAEEIRRGTMLSFLDYERNCALRIRLASWTIIYHGKLLDFKKTFYSNYQELIRLNEIRLSKGDISELDYRKLLLEGAKYQKDVDEENRDLSQIKNELRVLAGLDDSALWEINDEFTVPDLASVLDPEDQKKIENRSDIRTARAAVDAARADLNLQHSLAWPELGLGVIYHYEPQSYDFRANSYVGVGVTAPLKIFDRNQGNVQASESEVTRRQLEFDYALNSARSELQNHRVALETGYRILKNFEENNKINQDVYEKFRYMYLRGATGLVNLLDSERSYRQIQQDYLEQLFGLITEIELYRASIQPLDENRLKPPEEETRSEEQE